MVSGTKYILLSFAASPAAAPNTDSWQKEEKKALKKLSRIINHFDKESQK